MLPLPRCPLAGHAGLRQNTSCGSVGPHLASCECSVKIYWTQFLSDSTAQPRPSAHLPGNTARSNSATLGLDTRCSCCGNGTGGESGQDGPVRARNDEAT